LLQYRFHYVGLLRSPASWAKVARELLLALIELGHTVGATEAVDDRYQPEFQLPVALETILGPPPKRCIQLTFASPMEYPRLLGIPPRVGLLVNESTRWPPQWVAMAHDHVERVVVPSQFCRDTLADSGFPRNRIGVVHHGIDPLIYGRGNRPTPGSRSNLVLLFVGTPARRKGLDILLRALEQAFSWNDPVTLVIKTLNYSAEARPYLDQQWRKHVSSLQRRGYEINVRTSVLSEPDMADLYRSADLLCQPFRGEGFCLPLLEAMACGTPVLATGWSGPLDFVDESVGFVVRGFSLKRAGSMLQNFTDSGGEALMAEPDVDAVAAALREAATDRAGLASRGEAASRRASDWTWLRIARRLIADLVQSGLAN
jgi:glycosyltransferase involved in cell wall biosynthesis